MLNNGENNVKEGSLKKRKKPRIRNRKRNKCNRTEEVENTNQFNSSKANEEPKENEVIKSENNHKEIESSKTLLNKNIEETDTKMKPSETPCPINQGEKTREQIMAEREAKKLAKQAKKSKSSQNNVEVPKEVTTTDTHLNHTATINENGEADREKIKAQREAKKQEKQAAKTVKANDHKEQVEKVTQQVNTVKINEKIDIKKEIPVEDSEKKKPILSKAERRAIQEAQRAAKAQASTQKKNISTNSLNEKPQVIKTSPKANTTENRNSSPIAKATTPQTVKGNRCKVKLFNHLESAQTDVSLFLNNLHIHPSIARLGEQYAKRTVVGSNARCIAFMNSLKMVIQDFETPPKKEFARSLETVIKVSVEHLQRCRPLAVSVSNAYKHIKHVLTQLPPDRPESELKENLCHFIDTYIENQIGKAAQAISSSMQEKIKNGDVILTFGCSSLIHYICEEAHRRDVDFRVIVVDSRPFCEGQELLRRLSANEIPCTYVLINAIGFVMPEVTKVLLGAHALLSNGYVMARTGTAQVALMANSFNVPVLVCCETHKFSERFQTDAIVYNELGDPHDLVLNEKCCLTNWQSKNKMSPLNLIYDITPPELVTAVVTEVSILPCTSVPVILRIKPTEIGYYS